MKRIINGEIDPDSKEELKVGDFDELKLDEIVDAGNWKEGTWSTEKSSGY